MVRTMSFWNPLGRGVSPFAYLPGSVWRIRCLVGQVRRGKEGKDVPGGVDHARHVGAGGIQCKGFTVCSGKESDAVD